MFPSKPSYYLPSLNQQQQYFPKLLREKYLCVNLYSCFGSLPHLVSCSLANLLGSAFKTFRMQQLLLYTTILSHLVAYDHLTASQDFKSPFLALYFIFLLNIYF